MTFWKGPNEKKMVIGGQDSGDEGQGMNRWNTGILGKRNSSVWYYNGGHMTLCKELYTKKGGA